MQGFFSKSLSLSDFEMKQFQKKIPHPLILWMWDLNTEALKLWR